MSAITIENDLVHYEVLGRGRPVILIHGWLGSWRYWVPAMRQLSMQYRVYALDLWGYGDTAHDRARYTFEAQVNLLDQFMTKMGIEKAALVGHDLGAALIAGFAAGNRARVPRLMVVSPPLFRFAPSANTPPAPSSAPQLPAASDNPPKPPPSSSGMTEAPTMIKPPEGLQEVRRAYQEQKALNSDNKPARPAHEAAVPPVGVPAHEITAAVPPPEAAKPAPEAAKPPAPVSGEVQAANPLRQHLEIFDPVTLLERHVEAGGDLDKLKAEAAKAARDVIEVNVDSFTAAAADTFTCIRQLQAPVLMVYGTKDTFVLPPDAPMVSELKMASKFHAIPMEGIKHFPMLEAIDAFSRLLLEFLEAPDVTRLSIKETWERRVR